MEPMAGQGGILLMADTSKLVVPEHYLREVTDAAPTGVTRDWALCRYLMALYRTSAGNGHFDATQAL